jgi:hypothetical protein
MTTYQKTASTDDCELAFHCTDPFGMETSELWNIRNRSWTHQSRIAHQKGSSTEGVDGHDAMDWKKKKRFTTCHSGSSSIDSSSRMRLAAAISSCRWIGGNDSGTETALSISGSSKNLHHGGQDEEDERSSFVSACRCEMVVPRRRRGEGLLH